MKIGDTYEKYGTERLVINVREDGSVDSTTDLDYFKKLKTESKDKSKRDEEDVRLKKLEEDNERLKKRLLEFEEENKKLKKESEVDLSSNGEGEEKQSSRVEDKETIDPVEKLSEDMTCKFCGKICGSAVGLKAHMRACNKNPESGNYKELAE